jgi:hypothetical protein
MPVAQIWRSAEEILLAADVEEPDVELGVEPQALTWEDLAGFHWVDQ